MRGIMKVFSVFGITDSGKTTTVECIIKELRRRRYSVGTIKDIHFQGFQMDQEGTNTWRHRVAGSQLVTARGFYETDILFQEKMDIQDLLPFYHHDWLILEGVYETNVPHILCAHETKDIDERLTDLVFAISGRVSEKMTEYKGIPVINALKDIEKLVDLLEEKVFDHLPFLKPACCDMCGLDCHRLAVEILQGKRKREDCVLVGEQQVEVKIGGKSLTMVPFVQDIVRGAVEGVLRELDGYEEEQDIEIIIRK